MGTRTTAVLALTGSILAVTAMAPSAVAAPAQWNEANYQLRFIDTIHNTSHVCVGGYNQREQYVGHCWNTPTRVTDFSGWYWHGCIHVIGYNANWKQKRWDLHVGWVNDWSRNGQFVSFSNDDSSFC
ncbi:hypothetical protein [Kitasatospora sp. NPDC094011]|uniref:hypothetical protein n=1 Tax=Kitasatospora sp. NPDC094011 TaxID=3364090 RepID=UPI003804668E